MWLFPTSFYSLLFPTQQNNSIIFLFPEKGREFSPRPLPFSLVFRGQRRLIFRLLYPNTGAREKTPYLENYLNSFHFLANPITNIAAQIRVIVINILEGAIPAVKVQAQTRRQPNKNRKKVNVFHFFYLSRLQFLGKARTRREVCGVEKRRSIFGARSEPREFLLKNFFLF